MSRWRKLALSVGAVTACAVCWPSARSSTAASTVTSAEQKELLRRGERLARLEAKTSTTGLARSTPTGVRAAPLAPMAKGPEPTGELPPQIHEELSTSFAQQHEDADGSARLTSYLADALDDLGMGGAVDAVSCRQTLCRVNAHFSSLQDALRFQEEAGMPERRKSIELQIADGQVDVEVMFARGSEGEP